jgi:ubiquinone/menaquinone biosynthesis C-methylase UbiE
MDKWAAWLLHRRDGGDAAQRAKAYEHLVPIRDRVLERAKIRPGDVVLDVGGGDGLIAFGALELVGAEGRVILSDVSPDLVAHSQEMARGLGADDRMSFVETAAESLEAIDDASVDVVTTRSVLIYVSDKDGAFRAFHRVLRPGGRVSIFEPINNYFPDTPDEFWGFDSAPVRDLVQKIWAFEGWDPSSYDDDPMMNFTEKDLLKSAEAADFDEVHVELVVDIEPGTWVVDWNRLLETSPNPNAHTAGEAIRGALTEVERTQLEEHIRPLADEGRGTRRFAAAYLRAVRS